MANKQYGNYEKVQNVSSISLKLCLLVPKYSGTWSVNTSLVSNHVNTQICFKAWWGRTRKHFILLHPKVQLLLLFNLMFWRFLLFHSFFVLVGPYEIPGHFPTGAETASSNYPNHNKIFSGLYQLLQQLLELFGLLFG